MYSLDAEPATPRPWDPALVDWPAVIADVRDHRAATEMAISQRYAEIRTACRPPRLRDQEYLATCQENLDAVDEFLELFEMPAGDV